MKKFTRKFALGTSSLFTVLLLGVQSPSAGAQEAEAQASDAAEHPCSQCIKFFGWRGVLDFGLGYVSDDSLRFGDYRGLEEEGFYVAVDGDLHFRNIEGSYFDLYARNLGYDSRELDMRAGKQGRYELRFGWQEIPKFRGYGTQTPFLGVGSDFLSLPSDWVYATTTGGMTALESSLAVAPLKTEREILDAGATLHFSRNWSYRFDYQRQEKSGTRAMGGGLFFNNASNFPAPIDFTTDQFDMDLSWSGKRAQVKLGFFGSYFDNGDSSLTWQNPFTAHPQHSAFRSALEPDNEYYQFNLSGAYAFTPRIKLTGQAAIGRMSQDEAFLPATINPVYSDLPLPRSSLDGKVDTSTFNLTGKLSARLNNRLSFTARAKWDERDNKTPVDSFTQVPTDLLPTLPRNNRPYSFEREQYSADLRYRAHRVIRLSGGVSQYNIDRTLQATERTEETTFWGDVKVNPVASTQFRFKLESSNRDVDDYLQRDDGGAIDHPLMRKFNQADRERQRILVEFDFMPAGDFGINLSYFQAESDYDKSEIGLQESNEDSYTINFNYQAGEKLSVYAYLTQDNIDADLLNTTGGSAVPWSGKTRDQITTAGFGVSSRINEKSSFGLDFVHSDSEGDISVQTSLDEAPFEPLKTELRNATLHFDHEVNDNWGYKLYAEYEKFSSQDWAIDGLGVDGISSVLTMGAESPQYNVWYFRVQASYRF